MADPNATMQELSHFISEHTTKLNEYLAANKLPQPSFAADAPSPDYIPTSARTISKIRNDIADASQQLAYLARGPKATLIEHTMLRMHDSWTLQILNRHRIAQLIPLKGTKSFSAIAQESGLELDQCRRILRYAMTYHLFQEPSPDQVAHTAMSALLATDKAAPNLTSHCCEDIFPATASEANAIAKWPGSTDPTKCGIALGHNLAEGKSIFDWFGENPDRAQIFGGAMAFLGEEGTDISAMVEVAYGYDWAKVGKATLVDVGGSRGHVSFAIASVAPEMSFIVQDLPEVISQVSDGPPKGLEDRVRLQVYDFRTPQPVKDADFYLFRRIFHDWPDHICLEILKNLLPSMKIGARVVLNETILPGQEDKSAGWVTRMRRSLDMQMMVALSSRERSLEDWKALFESGSAGKLVFESAENSMLAWVRKD